MVMAQGRQEKWGLLAVLATVLPPVRLGEQSLSRALVTGMAHRGLGHRGLEAKTGTVLREGSLADLLVSRTAQVALEEHPWVKPGCVQGLGSHPWALGMLALGGIIVPMVP